MCWPYVFLLWEKKSVHSSDQFLIRLAFFVINLCESYVYFGYEFLSDMGLEFFPPFSKWPFHLVDGFLCCTEAFQFDAVQLTLLLESEPKIQCQDQMSSTLAPMFSSKSLVVSILTF